nr:AGE family epimerase/isomerase [Bacillus salacetis]
MNLKDEQIGGFFGEVRYDLSVNHEGDKGGIAASRFLWSFSAAYRHTGSEEYLDCANHAYSFLKNHLYDEEFGGLYWLLDYKGCPLEDQKHVYTQSFGIYALSEYYRATGNEEALKYANKLFDLIEEKGFGADNNAYKEELDRQWNELPNEKLSENGILAEITTNTHLHVLEAYTNLFNASPTERMRERLQNLLDIFYEKIYYKETKFLGVFFDRNWNSILDIQSFGHDIEASWLLDDAIKALGLEEERYNQMVIDIAYNIASTAVLEDGSLANEEVRDERDLTKIWWVQAEAAVGFQNAYQRTNDEKFKGIVEGLWAYISGNIVDPREGGEWYWSVEADGTPTERSVAEPWKTPYHNTRFCLEMMERLDD